MPGYALRICGSCSRDLLRPRQCKGDYLAEADFLEYKLGVYYILCTQDIEYFHYIMSCNIIWGLNPEMSEDMYTIFVDLETHRLCYMKSHICYR